MIRPMHLGSVNDAWRMLADYVLNYGTVTSPRGMKTREVSHATLSFPLQAPVLCCKERKLSYKFMAAEPLWYLSGSNRVADIAKYNSVMANFSDDGETLYGAYGPPICEQLDYVCAALQRDRDTRQAWLSIWKRNPVESKDVPCTIALGWRISVGSLHCHAVMRSSDTYLGVPYDWFSFSIISAYVACWYNRTVAKTIPERVQLGNMYWTAASSHIYERDIPAIRGCLRGNWVRSPVIPAEAVALGAWPLIEEGLAMRRSGNLPMGPRLFDLRPKW